MKLILGADTKRVPICSSYEELLDKARSVFERSF